MSVDDDKHLAQPAVTGTETVAAKKARAVAAIEDALAVGGDGWQRRQIAEAISWLYRGAYDQALVYANRVLMPASERPRTAYPDQKSNTPAALRKALAFAVAEPVIGRDARVVCTVRALDSHAFP